MHREQWAESSFLVWILLFQAGGEDIADGKRYGCLTTLRTVSNMERHWNGKNDCQLNVQKKKWMQRNCDIDFDQRYVHEYGLYKNISVVNKHEEKINLLKSFNKTVGRN
jgi:hypothetical protein